MTTPKYYPYQLITTGMWGKRNAISQVAYHHLASVLTKANRVAQSVVELGVTVARKEPVLTEVCIWSYKQAQYESRISK